MENRNTRTNNSWQLLTMVSYVLLFIGALPQTLHAYAKQRVKMDSIQQQIVQGLMQALKPGDLMPDAFWDMPMELDNFRGEKIKYTFGDMKGRVIIFDFWATTCKSCIENIPHLSEIQEKYPDNLAIILVNSKRNRDTPGRINATMKRYIERYNFDIGLFTILDDILLTTLFPHNSIPSTSWINSEGIYMGNTMPDEVNVKNIESILKTGKAELSLTQVYLNFGDRNKVPPLQDTVGADFISAITDYNPLYLPTYPNVFHENGSSSYQMVNESFYGMLSHAYKKELEGLVWKDYAFEKKGAVDIKYKLLNATDNKNIFSYQLYVRDSIDLARAEAYLRKTFTEHFKVKAERKKGEIEVYQVRYNANLKKIKTKGEMTIIQPYPGADPEQYRNVPVSLFLSNLFYYLDKPIVFDQNDNQPIDLVLPADFGQRSMSARLSYLADLGIELVPRRMSREYVYISTVK